MVVTRGVVIRNLLSLVIVCGFLLSHAIDCPAQDGQRANSLQIVPRSAAFYWASMNHAAQYKAVVDSNAYQNVMEADVAKAMRKAYRNGKRRGWNQFGQGNPFRNYLEGYSETVGSVPGKLALTFLKEIFANEVFVYGHDDCIKVSQAVSEAYRAIMAEIDGDFENFDEQRVKALIPVVRQALDGVNTPTVVIGTVLNEPARIEGLLQMAETGIDQVLNQLPEEMQHLADAYQVIEDDETYLITVTLTADAIPWDQIDDQEFQDVVPELQAMMDGKSIAIAFGIKRNFMLFSVGPSLDHLNDLGNGPLLVDHPQLKPLADAAQTGNMTSVFYMSEQVAKLQAANVGNLVDYMVMGIKIAVQQSDAHVQMDSMLQQLEVDAAELKKDIMAQMPQPGAYLGFSYLHDEGIEGYVYNWAENKYLDDSKPLSVLNHIGSDPVFAVATRNQETLEQFVVIRKWTRKLLEYVQQYVPQLIENPDELAVFSNLMTELKPILTKAADATQEDLFPATQNGQFAMVFDFSSAKYSWHRDMPAANQPVPLPALAVIIEVKDASKIKKAGSAYLASATELLELIRNIPGSDVPDQVQILPPQQRNIPNAGEMFFYPIPAEAGLNDSISPHALLNEQWLVLSYSTEQSPNLMSQNSPRLMAPLSDPSRPLMAAAYYNNRRMIDGLQQWANYGIQVAKQQGAEMALNESVENDTLNFSEAELRDAMDRVITLIKCFEGFASASYMKDGAQVTHYQMRFKDIPAK